MEDNYTGQRELIIDGVEDIAGWHITGAYEEPEPTTDNKEMTILELAKDGEPDTNIVVYSKINAPNSYAVYYDGDWNETYTAEELINYIHDKTQ